MIAMLTDIQELIKVNAFQVAPAELEAVLLEHEHIGSSILFSPHTSFIFVP